MKKLCRILSLLLTLVLCITMFSACSPKKDKEYLTKVSNYSFWENDSKTAVAEYNVYNLINDFLSDGKIVDGSVVDNEGKVRKVLFLGLDGMRADAVSNIVNDSNNFDVNGYNYNSKFSGINLLRENGGVYLAYCGGEKGEDTQQQTSTSASWTSQFTGVWGNKHGIITNDDVKNMQHKTIMLQYAEKGLNTSLAFDWDPYFDTNLSDEISYIMKNNISTIRYCDTDRKVLKAIPDESKAKSLEQYNFVANENPAKNVPYDVEMCDYLKNRINNGDDIVGGIFHNIDSNGHTYEFSNNSYQYVNSVRNCDNYSYELIQAVYEREKSSNEKRLVIMANDHGGIGRGHGEQSLEERTTWIATNYKIDKKYFSSNYDGYNLK